MIPKNFKWLPTALQNKLWTSSHSISRASRIWSLITFSRSKAPSPRQRFHLPYPDTPSHRDLCSQCSLQPHRSSRSTQKILSAPKPYWALCHHPPLLPSAWPLSTQHWGALSTHSVLKCHPETAGSPRGFRLRGLASGAHPSRHTWTVLTPAYRLSHSAPSSLTVSRSCPLSILPL